jgi:hypothetical protein
MYMLLFLMLSLIVVSQILTTYHLLAVTICFHSLQTVRLFVSVHPICVCRVFTYIERELYYHQYSCRFWLHHLLCLHVRGELVQ